MVGLNVYVLLALMFGNVLGTYLSFRSQQQDKHDPSGDLCAILAAIKDGHGDDPKFRDLKKGLQMWLINSPTEKCKDVIVNLPNTRHAKPLQISSGDGKNIRSRFVQSSETPQGTLDL